MKKIIELFLIGFVCFAFGQDQKIIALKQRNLFINCDVFLGYDVFGYYYFIQDNTLKKKKETEVFEYKNVGLGKITKADLQNPLKIALFYEDFNSVILLDNQLNEAQLISFSEIEAPIVASAVGLCSFNSLWIYNTLNQQIGLFDYLKKEYKILSTPLTENVKTYQSNFNHFYWCDSKKNWFSCDIFGKITALGSFDFYPLLFISNTNLIYKSNDHLYFYSLADKKATLIDLSIKTNSFFSYKDQILTIFTGQEIINYKITLP